MPRKYDILEYLSRNPEQAYAVETLAEHFGVKRGSMCNQIRRLWAERLLRKDTITGPSKRDLEVYSISQMGLDRIEWLRTTPINVCPHCQQPINPRRQLKLES